MDLLEPPGGADSSERQLKGCLEPRTGLRGRLELTLLKGLGAKDGFLFFLSLWLVMTLFPLASSDWSDHQSPSQSCLCHMFILFLI